jgi:pyruvate/2-oxoglutarate dehydrogenase complex dihydrolipoamide acyltransferase (E2) component
MLATMCKVTRILGQSARGGRVLASGVLLAVLSSGCGERLRRTDTPAAPPEAPVAKVNVTLDSTKVDADHKYTSNGQFTASGLFYKDNESVDATVLVNVSDVAGKLSRTYDFDYASVAGTTAKVEMWDGGFLTVVVPSGGAEPQFQTSNPNVKAVGVTLPSGESTCYFGKGTVDGDLRLALCSLETPKPVLRFVDGAGIPATPPSGEAAPEAPAAEGAAPAAPAAPEPTIPEGPAKKKP